MEAIIDLEDLERVVNYKYKWHSLWGNNIQNYYVMATKYLGIVNGKPKYDGIYLHRFIMNVIGEENVYVDHKNHNSLDNKKLNLRVTDNSINGINRQGINTNNNSGYRNVSWDKSRECWIVQLQIDGKNKCLGNLMMFIKQVYLLKE